MSILQLHNKIEFNNFIINIILENLFVILKNFFWSFRIKKNCTGSSPASHQHQKRRIFKLIVCCLSPAEDKNMNVI